jgi:hypothetical protein
VPPHFDGWIWTDRIEVVGPDMPFRTTAIPPGHRIRPPYRRRRWGARFGLKSTCPARVTAAGEMRKVAFYLIPVPYRLYIMYWSVESMLVFVFLATRKVLYTTLPFPALKETRMGEEGWV